MKVGMGIFLFILLASLALATNVVINDAENDVENPSVDIVKIWTEEKGDKLVFNLKVKGNINTTSSYIFQVYGRGDEFISVSYENGSATYVGTGDKWGNARYEIKGNTISIYVPASLFKDWEEFYVIAIARHGNQIDWAEEGDPTQEKPTDESIRVSIKKVEYDIRKEGDKWNVYFLVEGNTNGVDHVSLNIVIYYENGTYEWGKWIRGPIKLKPGYFYGMEVTEFSFNATKGKWEEWKYIMRAKVPLTSSDYKWAKNWKEIDKLRIYARAFGDAEEKKWNQCYMETRPEIKEEEIAFGLKGNHEGKRNRDRIPGFEIMVAITAILLMWKRNKFI